MNRKWECHPFTRGAGLEASKELLGAVVWVHWLIRVWGERGAERIKDKGSRIKYH